MTFYIGTHEPSWLHRTISPLFISRRRLARYRGAPPKAWGNWALDSGGFSELSLFGRWETGATRYAEEADRWRVEIGNLDFAATQDWMCEPFVIEKTGKSIAEHQRLTVQSHLDLTALAPAVPWMPVLQGWTPDDYLDHAEQYAVAGIDLASLPRVGVGSICRRQGTQAAEDIILALKPLGLRLHAFGVKVGFLKMAFAHGLASCDSMAWSYRARRRGSPLPGCTHKSCANCFDFAMRWRDDALRLGKRPQQMSLV